MRDIHVQDEQLLLHASGELSVASERQVRDHLEGCPVCRGRLTELEGTLAEFGSAHHESVRDQIVPLEDSRAAFTARLANASAQRGPGQRRVTVVAALGVAACLMIVGALYQQIIKSRTLSLSASRGHGDEPDTRLTPGVTVPVTESQLCSSGAEASVPTVPVSLASKVFALYGVARPQPDAYEVDYLITPELGGATDIRNLWPEPYQNTVWNAHVKDQLEDRLHRMVCHGEVDLTTAQRDISRDWIAAYRKYFHAERPVSDTSSSNRSALTAALPLT